MSKEGKRSDMGRTFIEGEYLKDFMEIEQALEANMRTEVPGAATGEELPYASVETLMNQQLAEARQQDSEGSALEEPAREGVPFSSASRPPESGRILSTSDESESVIYRQARRGKKVRYGRRGIWRLLPHIGHRKRHWLQRNLASLGMVTVLVLALGGLYVWRVRPQIALSALDDFTAASRAHAEGRYQDAITLYQQYIRASSEASLRTLEAHYYLGCCLENTGQRDKAQAEYGRVWSAYRGYLERLPAERKERRQYDRSMPDVFSNAVYDLGQLAWQSQDYTKAQEYYQVLLHEFPNFIFASEVKERLQSLQLKTAPSSLEPGEGKEGAVVPEKTSAGLGGETDEPVQP